VLAQEHDPDFSLEEKQRISLMDAAYDGKRLEYPARGSACTHAKCFGLFSLSALGTLQRADKQGSR
jgi:hypothetical protein